MDYGEPITIKILIKILIEINRKIAIIVNMTIIWNAFKNTLIAMIHP